ncbi:ankyrin repeat-containing protein [Cadophora sp. MPI-SDFR-AT-0126]|nr:ankyrin repeat-containing protein [Leotiomycetes sp. MPI-SDFR-AT-0126]
MSFRNFDKLRSVENISTTTGYCSDPTIGNSLEEVEEEDRWTDLQLASRDGDLPTIERLLSEPSTNINAPPIGWYGQNALQAACAQSHTSVVARLIAAGADVNAAGDFNRPRTALQIAAVSGNVEIVDMLLAAGADVNVPAAKYNGRTALQAASEGGHLPVIEKLLEIGEDVNAPGAHYGGLTALQASCSPTSNIAAVGRLLAAGADVNAPPSRYFGLTALQNASLHGNLEVVNMLLDHGADVNAAGAYNGGGTALLAAAECGYVEIVKRLLDAGADAEVVSGQKKQTALQVAAANGHGEVFVLLEAAVEKANARKREKQLSSDALARKFAE